MSYKNTFIKVAPDCPVTKAVVPESKREKKPIHQIHYEMLSNNPYKYTHEALIFEADVQHKGIAPENIEAHRKAFFQKKHPCLRASQLPKKYGWGIHYDAEGKIALYGMETEAYQKFSQSDLQILYAMRSSRKKPS
ncbi:DUF6157 family protein [Camelliibacillus cellulosilyticus]|uniref:DUF6157 family protein n=1 Tax=Camelliibacillus cellulosilyticus TaxID=2174486 RepID=A0ABV9GQC8_9BACL